MTDKNPLLSLSDLLPDLKEALIVLGTTSSTDEALQKALSAVRTALLKKNPTISARDIVYSVSELTKRIGGDTRQVVASLRMRRHLVERGEIKPRRPGP